MGGAALSRRGSVCSDEHKEEQLSPTALSLPGDSTKENLDVSVRKLLSDCQNWSLLLVLCMQAEQH